MTQAEINANKLDNLCDLIWSKYVQVYMDITYASMLSDRLRSKQSDWYFWGVYICLGLPSVLSILVKNDIISKGWIIYLVCAVILIVPIILKCKNRNLVYTALGIFEKRISGLFENNVKLEQFKDDLILLYFEADNENATATNVSLIETKYQNLSSRSQEYVTTFQNLVGEIDIDLENRAQVKTEEMIKSATFYGEETKN